MPECQGSVHDQPWDPSRTALVRTNEGNIFRVRWLAYDGANHQVSFEYSAVPEPGPAEPPPSVFRFTQQGRLLDTSGNPIEGNRSLAISLYDGSEGTQVWNKLYTNTSFNDGFFSVTLSGLDDSDRPLDGIQAAELFMSFAVDGVSIGDRQPISMVPAAARAHGAAIIDATAPCGVVGGLGYDTSTSDLHVCTGTSWQRIGLSGQDEPACPDGMVALGSSCIDSSVQSSDHWDDAVSDCMGRSARLCSEGEMVYACKQRDALSLGMPDTQWMWLETRSRLVWTNNRTAAANHVYRRQGNTCFERNNSYDASPLTVSWDWGTTQYGYYCCADPR